MKYQSMTVPELAAECGVSVQYIRKVCRSNPEIVSISGKTIEIKKIKKIGSGKNAPYLITVSFSEKKNP